MEIPFHNRRDAGRLLALRLSRYANHRDVVVLALPRGGVPVGYEVARSLSAPLDVFIVRKLGAPGHEELAMGAVSTSGVYVLNDPVVESLAIPAHMIEAAVAREQLEIARQERLYRGGRPPVDVDGRIVILVDDGLATGSTTLAALKALRQRGTSRLVVAVPVAPPDACQALQAAADEAVCAMTPDPFHAVSVWYEDFSQTTDSEVRQLLADAALPAPGQAARSW